MRRLSDFAVMMTHTPCVSKSGRPARPAIWLIMDVS